MVFDCHSAAGARLTVLAFCLVGAVLVWSAPEALSSLGRSPRAFSDLLVAAVTVAAVGLYGWLALGALVTAASSTGCWFAQRLTDVIVPAAWARTVSSACGCAVALLPLSAGLGGAAAALNLAASDDDRGGGGLPRSTGLPLPERPTAGNPVQLRLVVRAGDSLWAIAARELGQHPTPEQIAARWPRWYRTNVGVIGPDPDLILPGMLLRAPTANLREGHR